MVGSASLRTSRARRLSVVILTPFGVRSDSSPPNVTMCSGPSLHIHGAPMSEPESLQFDRVEVVAGSSSATICAECRQAIVQSYYEINASLICSRCHELRMQGSDGSKTLRVGRSLAAGFGAAIL